MHHISSFCFDENTQQCYSIFDMLYNCKIATYILAVIRENYPVWQLSNASHIFHHILWKLSNASHIFPSIEQETNFFKIHRLQWNNCQNPIMDSFATDIYFQFFKFLCLDLKWFCKEINRAILPTNEFRPFPNCINLMWDLLKKNSTLILTCRLLLWLFNTQGSAHVNIVNIHLKCNCRYIIACWCNYQPWSQFVFFCFIDFIFKTCNTR